MKLDYYKELYDKEIEHTERLNSKIEIMLTLLTLLGSGEIYLWTQYRDFSFCDEKNIFNFLICSSILFFICIYAFCRAYTGYEIHYYPIEDMEKAIKDTYKLVEEGKISTHIAKKHVKDMMIERYLNDAIHNSDVNVVKSDRIRRLINWCIVTFVSIVVGYILLWIDMVP